MSDWEDFVESYRYQSNDPDAFEKIFSPIWEHDRREELKAELKEKYEAGLAKGKASQKKSYHKSKIKKFGFSNFKPYGEMIQSFSKKPITLVYGPNSIGKSSFIHINAYNNFIQKTQNLDLHSTNMFGDEINLGGFSKFIHKRDKNNTLKLEYEFEDCSDAIIDFLELSNDTQFDLEALSKFSALEIEDIIKSSEYYIYEIIMSTETDFFGVPYEKPQYEVAKLKAKRKNNNSCLYVYPNESNFIFYYTDNKSPDLKRLIDVFYRIIPYIDSNDYEEYKFEKQGYFNFHFSRNVNLENIDEKNEFISDILIPYFINEAKLQYVLANKIEFKSLKEPKQLNSESIKKIAEKTIELISQLVEKYKFKSKLKSSPISLKIISEIKYITRSKHKEELNIVAVSYYINNQLFDKLTYEEMFDGLSGYKQRTTKAPDIFKNIPDFIKEKIYSDNAGKNSSIDINSINTVHEQNTSILFLSYKMGYNYLIGAFNDMLGFNDIQYIGPLRFYPERDSSFKELDSDESIMPNSKTSWSYLKEDSQLRDNINKWLKNEKKLKTPYKIKYRKLLDKVSILNKLELKTFEKIQQDIAQKNEIINKYDIRYDMKGMSMNLQTELEDIFNHYFDPSKNSSEISWQLFEEIKHFSKLNKSEQFKYSLEKNNIFDNLDYKEELIFEDLRNGTHISNRDLGLGVSQILPVLIATNRQKNTTIAIEQPELHLHPSIQCEIADEFIRSYHQNKNEFIIETHSEHLLLRIMKRMRWKAEDKKDRDKSLDITPDDICLLYVDTNGKSTYIKELELDVDGSLLDPWPKGFFEDSYKERFE